MSNQVAYAPVKVVPADETIGPIGFLRAMINDPVSAIPPAAYKEPITIISVMGTSMAFVSDPALLEEILIRRMPDFPKSRIDKRVFRPAFRNGLLTAHGEEWRWKRRLAAPYFTPSALARSVPDMVAPFQALVDEWQRGDPAAPRDVTSAITWATFDVICRTLFSSQDAREFAAILDSIADHQAPIAWVIGLASLRVPAWVPHPGYFRLRRGCHRMQTVVGDLVAARRDAGRAFDDVCGDLMQARDPETQRPLSDDDLVDMLLTLIAAGHETSANALSWALYCMAEQPDLQEQLADEVARVVGTRPVDADDLPALTTIEAFLKETMRLFPPIPLMARQTSKTEELGGHTLKRGTVLFIPVYAIHRHERLWPAPDAFDLSRFQGGGEERMSRTAYMPFGAGPRVCVGGTFAMMEMKAGLATLLQRFRFSSVEGARCVPVQRITLRPRDTLRLTATPAAPS